LIVSPAVFDGEILTFDKSSFFKARPDGSHDGCIGSRRRAAEKSDHRHRRLLRPCRKRPCRRATEKRDEFPPFQLIELHPLPLARVRA
jgi:hypothetical protein